MPMTKAESAKFFIEALNEIYECDNDATEDEKNEHKIWLWGMEQVLLYQEGLQPRYRKKKLESMPGWKQMKKTYSREWIDFRKMLEKEAKNI